MKRVVGSILMVVGWVVAPSVALWFLGAPWWGWLAAISVIPAIFLVAATLAWVESKWGTAAAWCTILIIFIIALTVVYSTWKVVLIVLGALCVISAMVAIGMLGLRMMSRRN